MTESNKALDTVQELKELVAPFVTVEEGKVKFDAAKAKEAVFEKLETKESELKRSYEAVTEFNNAARMAIGEKAIDFLAENKKEEQVAIKYKVAGEKVNVVCRRQKEVHNPISGATTTVMGATSISRTVTGVKSTNNSIRDHLAAIGAKKLG